MPFSFIWHSLPPGSMQDADVGVTHDGSIEAIVKVLLVEQDDVGFSNSILELEVFTEVGDCDNFADDINVTDDFVSCKRDDDDGDHGIEDNDDKTGDNDGDDDDEADDDDKQVDGNNKPELTEELALQITDPNALKRKQRLRVEAPQLIFKRIILPAKLWHVSRCHFTEKVVPFLSRAKKSSATCCQLL